MSLRREVALASVGIVILLTVLKSLDGVPFFREYASTIAAAVQLYVPILLIGRLGITRDSLGLSTAHWKRDLLIVLVLSIGTVVPFAIAHHFWQTELYHRSFVPRLPPKFGMSVLTQLLVVALPEELFFRGYLQARMEQIWPAQRRLFGTPFGKAIVLAAFVFALCHFMGEYQPARLGPFFPALLFGLLRTRTGGILAPVTYHAFCNLLSEALYACYKPV